MPAYFDITIDGNGLETFGFESFGAFSGVGLNTFGFIWDCAAIWSKAINTPTNSWSNADPSVTTNWSAADPSVTTTWTITGPNEADKNC